MNPRLPFSAVVGQEPAQLALLLVAAEPRLGGVLLRGQKGSAKTTLARGLAALLPGDAPFIELPLGATEDRVLGSVDAAHLLTTGEMRVRPGLLAAAHGGVLYVDEVNLLADHLMDALLDAAASGIGRVERDGIAHTYPARFVLIGSMNPEEGELRPQLLDRFGLAVDIEAPTDTATRVAAVTRQLGSERGDGGLDPFTRADDELRDRLSRLVPAALPPEIIELACRVALEVGAEGLRADLMLSRAAAALATWDARTETATDDVRRVAPFVLAHRKRRTPFDEPGITDSELDQAFDQAGNPDPPERPDPGEAAPDPDTVVPPGAETRAPTLPTLGPSAAPNRGRRAPAPDDRGRFVRGVPAGTDPAALANLAVAPTALAVGAARAIDPTAPVTVDHLHTAVRQGTTGHLVIIAVDTSSSMGAHDRIAITKGAVLGLLTDVYQRRDRVALIAFRGERAEVVLRPTGSVEVARARLADLPVGGTTPLAHALDTAGEIAKRSSSELQPVVVVVTDGRATAGGDDPLAETHTAAERLAALGTPTLVIDAEDGIPRLGLAADLAERLGGDCVALASLDSATGLTNAIRALTR